MPAWLAREECFSGYLYFSPLLANPEDLKRQRGEMMGVGVGIIQVHTADLCTRTREEPPPYLVLLKVRE